MAIFQVANLCNLVGLSSYMTIIAQKPKGHNLEHWLTQQTIGWTKSTRITSINTITVK